MAEVLEEILRLKESSDEIGSRAFERLQTMQNGIKRGEVSTGNKIKDMLLLHSAKSVVYNPEICDGVEATYLELESKLNQPRQEVLVVKGRERRNKGLIAEISPTKRCEIMELGVLVSNIKVDVIGGNIVLPTAKHLVHDEDKTSSGGYWILEDGPIRVEYSDFREIDQLPTILPLYWLERSTGFSVYSGEEVERYFGVLNCTTKKYIECLELLGVGVPIWRRQE